MIAKLSYTKQLENGTFKRVTEPYLVDAFSFTECEARVHSQLGALIKGDFQVKSIVRQDCDDILATDDFDAWYKVTVEMEITEDESKPKKVKKVYFVTGSSVDEAYRTVSDLISTFLVPCKITESKETPIVDYLKLSDDVKRSEDESDITEDHD